MTKKHYGYRDGKVRVGDCNVTVGTCPYGNHSEDPSKINDQQEYVSEALGENPNYETLLNAMVRMYGEKNVTAKLLMGQGIPEKLAKIWANEPVSEEYERDYVSDGTPVVTPEPEPVAEPTVEPAVEPVAESIEDVELPHKEPVAEPQDSQADNDAEAEAPQEPSKPAPPAVRDTIPTADELADMYPNVSANMRMRLWKNDMRQAGVPIPKPEDNGEPSDDELAELYPQVPSTHRRSVWKRDKEHLERVHRWNRDNTAFTNIAAKLSDPNLAGTLTEEEKSLLEEPYKDIDYINRAIYDNYAGKTLETRSYDETSAIRAIADYGAKGNQVDTGIIQSHFGDDALPNRAKDRELARRLLNPDYILDNPRARIRGSRELEVSELREIVSVGKDTAVEDSRRALANAIDDLEFTITETRTLKEGANAKPNPSLDELKEKARQADANNGKPASLFTAEGHHVYSGDDSTSKAQREEAAEHWKRNFKPGSHIMMGEMDAEVYTLQPDGRVTSSTGRNVGYADYKTGDLRGTDGLALLDHRNGVRLYGSADALIRDAVADGDHVDIAHKSADPGFLSKYEIDPAYAEPVFKMTKYLDDRDAALTARSKRNEETYHAQRATDDPAEMYEKLNKVGFTIPSYEANMHVPNAAEGIRNRMSSYIADEIQAGRLQYNQDTKEFMRSNRPDTAKMEPKLNYDEIFDGKGNLAENVSLMNAVRRTRNIMNAHDSQLADGLAPAVGKYNPAASRRKNWGDTPISAAKAKDGDILTTNTLNSDDTVSTYVVLDAKNRIVAPVIDGRTPVQAQVEGVNNAQASEDAVINIEKRAKAKDATLFKVQLTEDFRDEQGRVLELW